MIINQPINVPLMTEEEKKALVKRESLFTNEEFLKYQENKVPIDTEKWVVD